MINLSVHFNQFIVLTPNEVLPAVEAFEKMFDQITCPSCHGLVAVVTQNNIEAVVLCPCRGQTWPLPARDSLPREPAGDEAS